MTKDYRIALPLVANLLRELTRDDDVTIWRRVFTYADKTNTEFMMGKELAKLLTVHTPMHGADPASVHGLIKGLLKMSLPKNVHVVYENRGTRDNPIIVQLADTAQQLQFWGLLRVGYWIKIQSRTPAGNLVGEPFWTRLLEWEHLPANEEKRSQTSRAVRTVDADSSSVIWRLPSNYQLQSWAPAVCEAWKLEELQQPLQELAE